MAPAGWDRKRVAALVALIVLAAAIIAGVFILRDSERFRILMSREALREWVTSLGVWAPVGFFGLQMLQVVVSPIPGGVTTLVGGALFGMWPAFFLSTAAVFAGSLVAFGLARALGRPLVVRLVGPKATEKYLGAMTSRGRIAFLLMFLLPFFPDDALSAIAGLTGISWAFFALAVLITRPWGLLFSSLVGSGILNVQSWGWALIAAGTAVVGFSALKWGPAVEQRLYERITRKSTEPEHSSIESGS